MTSERRSGRIAQRKQTSLLADSEPEPELEPELKTRRKNASQFLYIDDVECDTESRHGFPFQPKNGGVDMALCSIMGLSDIAIATGFATSARSVRACIAQEVLCNPNLGDIF